MPQPRHSIELRNWTDSIYANGEKIAKVASQTPVLHLSGVCGSCGGGASNYFVSALAANLAGYTIQSGDKLVFRQKQNGPVTAGLYVFATDGTNSMLNLFDTQGYTINAFGDDSDTWQTRVVNLSGWAGKQISTNLGMSVEAWTQPGAAWDSWVSDVTLVSVSGVSYPMFNGQALGGSPWSPGAGSTFAMSTDTDPAVGTRYYLDDHLGTTQMELSAGGWPVWQGSFTPFGQEIIGGSTTNYLGQQPQDGTAMRYKFTGKERDAESGLDYFGARYYASNMGRFTSPDWSAQEEPVPYAKLGDPQSLNLYDYVGNNPLSRGDPDGHRSTIGIHSEFQFAEIGTNQVDPVFNTPAGWAVSNGLGAYGTPDPPAPQQNGQPAPTNPDGSVKNPGKDVPALPDGKGPDGKLSPNEWVPVPGTPDRPTKWKPKYPIPGGSQPGVSWDPDGHWDHDNGTKGGRTRWLPGGGALDSDHNPIFSVRPGNPLLPPVFVVNPAALMRAIDNALDGLKNAAQHPCSCQNP